MHGRESEAYWEHAGKVSYAEKMFSSSVVEKHANRRLWHVGIGIGRDLGLNGQSTILDLGCGDGALANLILSRHYRAVDGFDLAAAAIKRAQALAERPNVRFEVCDITTIDFSRLPPYDGAYLWGILHHVKKDAPAILAGLRTVTKRVVVLEPNGNNLVRKLLEHTPGYRAAGEDSFRAAELERIFRDAGFRPVIRKRLNIFANFTPEILFRLLRPLEPAFENTPLLRALCTVNMWGLAA